jgi:hypothetical protein
VRLGLENTVTYVADVVIPPGDRPVFLLIGFRNPVVLRLSGATGRVVEALSIQAAFGVTGLARSQLKRFGTTQGDCEFEFWRQENQEGAREQVRVWTGDAEALIETGYTIGRIDFTQPQGARQSLAMGAQVQPSFDAAAQQVWQQMLRYNPGGVVAVDMDRVNTTDQIAAYAVMPQEAGIAQLVQDGILTPLADRSIQDIRTADQYGTVVLGDKTVQWSGGDDAVLSDDLIYSQEAPGQWVGRKRAEYRVNAAMTLPNGMSGAHLADFLLPPGVPAPLGERGHTRIRPLEVVTQP